MDSLKKIIAAPKWLEESNARQRQQPPPTIEVVRQQMRASEKFRRKMLKGKIVGEQIAKKLI